MNIYSLPPIISFTINFSIAFIVLMEKPKASINRWLAALIFIFAVWNLSEVFILNSANLLDAYWWAHILYRIIFFAPAFYVVIAYLFPRNFHKFATNPLFYIALFSLPILALSLSFPDFQIQLFTLKDNPLVYYYNFTLNFRPALLMLLIISISYIVWGSIVLGTKIRHLRTTRLQNQTRFFLIGMVVIFMGFTAIVILKTGIRNPAYFYFFSTIFTFFVAVFFFIAIIRFHLLKPGKLFSKGATYTALSVLIFAVYFFVIRMASGALELWIGINSAIFETLLVVVLIFIILPFEKLLQDILDQWLNKDMQQYRKNILILLNELEAYCTRNNFFEIVTRFIADNFKSSAVYILDYHKESGRFLAMETTRTDLFIPEDAPIVSHLKRGKKAIEFYEFNEGEFDKECRSFFENVHAKYLLPIINENNLLAVVVLCRKKYGLEYSENEREMLTILGSQIAVLLRRNQIIEEMREKDRRRFQMEKLAAIGQLTANVAHEILNPLNTISTSAETLLRKDISDADQDELKQFIIEESNRLKRILSDFLNFARIKPAVSVEIDMENMLERLCLALQNSDEMAINVSHEIDAGQKMALSDPDMIFQALLNLGLNARAGIKERCQGEGNFACEDGIIKYAMKNDGNRLILSVTDNGAGIPPEIRKSIYDPFFTTRENGTGLGLSIVHQIVEVLSGFIECTSQRGHTCFCIYLPKQQETAL